MSYVTSSNNFIVRPEIQHADSALTQSEISSIEDQQRRLNYFAETAEKENTNENVFVNLSIKDLLRNFAQTMIHIINELLEINRNTTFNDILLIFIKNDRLISVGLLMVMIGLSIYIIDITS